MMRHVLAILVVPVLAGCPRLPRPAPHARVVALIDRGTQIVDHVTMEARSAVADVLEACARSAVQDEDAGGRVARCSCEDRPQVAHVVRSR